MRLLLTHPGLNDFQTNLDPATNANIAAASNDGVYLIFEAAIDPKEILFLVGIAGEIQLLDNFDLSGLYVSVFIGLSAPEVAFGIVADMRLILGNEINILESFTGIVYLIHLQLTEFLLLLMLSLLFKYLWTFLLSELDLESWLTFADLLGRSSPDSGWSSLSRSSWYSI